MATVQYYMNYTIFFNDEAEYQFAIAVAGGTLLKLAPRDAAALFGISFPYPSGAMSSIPKGITFYFPFSPGSQFNFPNASGIFVDDTVLTTVVPGQAGVPAAIWPAGPDGVFTWAANIVRSEGAGAATTTLAAIPTRRWISGRELYGGETGTNGTQNNGTNSTSTRDASRTLDGIGWCLRGQTGISSSERRITDLRPALAPATSWERFYFRIRTLPSATTSGIWRTKGTAGALSGVSLKIKTTGELTAFLVNGAGVETDQGAVFTPTVRTWYRVDVLIKYATGGGTTGIAKFYINGVFAFTVSNGAGLGLNAVATHFSSELGQYHAAGDTAFECDLDDWIDADLPAWVDPLTLGDNSAGVYNIDWLMGSHIRAHWAVSGAQTGWLPAGKVVGLNQPCPEPRLGTTEVTSATALSVLESVTDLLTQAQQDTYAAVLGPVAAEIILYSKTSDGSDGTLGYRLAGGVITSTLVNQLVADGYNNLGYLPVGATLPAEISPFSQVHEKANTAGTDTSYLLATIVEHIGVWGPEDDATFAVPFPRISYLHNCKYSNSVYGYFGSEPDAPVFAVGGTYVGNGTYQEITLPGPCHFLYIHLVAGGTTSAHVFGASVNAHSGATERCIPQVRMWYDFAARVFKFSVSGAASSTVNVNTSTYQYIAFCDPGMRFNLCSSNYHQAVAAVPQANPLVVSDFLPDFSLFNKEELLTASAVLGCWARGPGNSGNGGTPLNGGVLDTTLASFTSGVLNSFASLHSAKAFTYSLWRTADSGPGGCASNVMVQVTQYTGNGASGRVIPLVPASGRFPLFVLITPASGGGQTSYVRTPSHTGTQSGDFVSTVITTNAIVGVGIDTITINPQVNVNTTVYNVFVISGDTLGMNNGTFSATYCQGPSVTGPWTPPGPLTGDINVLGSGGIDFDGVSLLTLLKDISGIYTLVTGRRTDTLIDRQTGQSSVDIKIPDPLFKTGYVGG